MNKFDGIGHPADFLCVWIKLFFLGWWIVQKIRLVTSKKSQTDSNKKNIAEHNPFFSGGGKKKKIDHDSSHF